MTAKKRIFSAVFLAAAILLLAAAPMAALRPAYAETITIETPKTQNITNAQLNEYKGNLFYDGSYLYEEENYTLNYRYYKPADAQDPMPLILFLHGRGERGTDNDSQLNNAIMRPFIENENSKFYDAMVIAPQCPVKENNNGWVDLFTDNTLDYHNYSVDAVAESVECKAIVSLIEDACEKNNIDRNRIYLIGVSQGAIATWDLLARHSELFAAAVPISGVGDVSKAEIYADIPIYAFHGQQDTTVPYATATPLMYEAIDALGKGKMNFVAFSDGPHAIWEAAIVFQGSGDLPALEDWLFSQSRSESGKGCGSTLGAELAVPAVVSAFGGALLIVRKRKS